jgi:3-deoxy-D-manno-octulosonic-acid transferase
MKRIYSLSIRIYSLIIRIASLFNTKARLWINGRHGIWERLIDVSDSTSRVIWIHCSSLGEFEQGRPVIEKLKSTVPGLKILLTFFSPSGYTVRKNYSQCDWVEYMPLDTMLNARRFIHLVKPCMVLFIKYEFWYHHLAELKRRAIPTYLISANFRENQVFFKWYGSWYRKMLHTYSSIFVQNEKSKSLLAGIGINNVLVAGDTRFDRVKAIMEQSKVITLVEEFSRNHFVIVAGSTWDKDEDILFTSLKNTREDIKLIIAPHEISKLHLGKLKNSWNGQMIFYSEAKAGEMQQAKILVIDNVGILSSLYKYGVIAYVGGGFGKGIHNILEAATYGMPVIFGPHYRKFQEAIQMVELKAAFPITSVAEFDTLLAHCLRDDVFLQQTSTIAARYVSERTGATDFVLSIISKELNKK